jgi:hypothetical protein
MKISKLDLMPYVSDTEQAEIEAELGLPADAEAEEWVEMTDWVKYDNQVPQISG